MYNGEITIHFGQLYFSVAKRTEIQEMNYFRES